MTMILPPTTLVKRTMSMPRCWSRQRAWSEQAGMDGAKHYTARRRGFTLLFPHYWYYICTCSALPVQLIDTTVLVAT